MINKLKIVSFNVNGIRAIIKKDFYESVKKMNADILCIQETKAHPDQVDHKMYDEGYKYEFWNSAQKKGYSGTAIFSKIKPIDVNYDLGIEKHDTEGRVITAEFENFFLINVYTPNSKQGLERVDYRTEEWDKDFLNYMKKLEKTKPVILCGDLNVAHCEIDLKNPQSNKTTATKPGSCGFTNQERKSFDNYLAAEFIDTFRQKNPNKIKYSWWSYMFNARKNNAGWRIDYFLVTSTLYKFVKEADILNEIYGSDHCPVSLEIEFK